MIRASRVLTGLAVALICGPAFAAEPTKTPTAKPTGEKTLSDVAGDIKLNKEAAGGTSSIVISNENLNDLADKGRVTEVTKSGQDGKGRRGLADVKGTGAEVEGEMPGATETMEKKQYWQAIYGQQIDMVHDIVKQIEVLDYEIPGLWRDFYSWDDPAYRDGVIKPKLDKALADRQKLEVEMRAAEGKLNEIKKQARKDGAQPSWFRGFEKLPTPKPTVGIMPP